MTAKQAAEFLDLIADRAQVLRERGVRRVELGGVAFVLAGPELEPARTPAGQPGEDGPPPDELHDPATHGLRGPNAPRVMPRRVRTPLVEPDP